MKIFTWLAGMLFLVAAASTAVLLLVEKASMAQTRAQVFIERRGGSSPRAGVTADGVRAGRKAFADLLEEKGRRVEVKTQTALTGLTTAFRLRDSSSAPGFPLQARIEGELQAAREAQDLDLLILVTQDHEVFSAESQDCEAMDLRLPDWLMASESFFRQSNALSGVDIFPTRYASPGAVSECSGADLFLFTCAPLRLRPEATQAVLIGGVSVHTLAPILDEVLAQEESDLLWHVFLDERGAEPVVISGDEVGTPLRREFYRDLLREDSSSEAAFVRPGVQLGSWMLVRNLEGRAVGGWGVTAPVTAEKRPMAFAPRALQAAGRAHFSRSWVRYLGSATALSGGLFVLFAFYVLRGKNLARGRTPTPKLESAELTATPCPAPSVEEIVSQFETNWKTFASYTQDLFHRKLKELHSTPQKEVGEVQAQVAQLAEALVGIREDLSCARKEIKDTTHGVVEKMTLLVGQDSQNKSEQPVIGEDLLRKVEEELREQAAESVRREDALLEKLMEKGECLEVAKKASVDAQRRERELSEDLRVVREANERGLLTIDDLKQKIKGLEMATSEGQARDEQLRQALEEKDSRTENSQRECSELAEELAELKGKLLGSEESRSQSEKVCRELQERLELEEVSANSRAAALEQAGEELESVRLEKAEVELEMEVQSRFRENLTRSLPALVVVDGQCRVMSWNRNAESLLEVPENEALGEELFSLRTPLKKEAFQQRFEEARQARSASRTRVRFASGGISCQYLVTQSPFLGGDDSVRGTVLLIQELARDP